MKNNKNAKYDMGAGIILEIIPTIPNEHGNNLEGFLYYNDRLLDTSNHKVLFKENTEVIAYFKNNVLPEHITECNIKEIKFLKGKKVIRKFVKEYVKEKVITYGTTIDVISILESKGYEIPNKEDTSKLGDLLDYFKCVNTISLELKNQLREFGFDADRNTKNFIDHKKLHKHDNCRNLVFTRYPWTAGFKAIKVINDFISSSEHDFTKGIEFGSFNKLEPKSYEAMVSIIDTVGLVHKEAVESIQKKGFESLVEQFEETIAKDKEKLIRKWRKRAPKNYGVYKEDK